MAEELIQGGICGGNWWNPARSLFGSSPCSSAINDIGNFGWPSDQVVEEMKKTWSNTHESNSDSDGQMSHQPGINSTPHTGINSTPHMITHHWNQDFLQENGISEENYSQIKPANQNSSMNYHQQTRIDCSQINQMDWSSKNFSTVAQNSTFPFNSPSDSYTSSFLQTLFDADSDQPRPSDSTPAMELPSPPNFPVESNEFSRPLKLSNNTSFPAIKHDARPNLLASTFTSLSSEEKKSSGEPAFKRTRIETPSPLPTFKVRKEKLGDRITALQQLVSPFGKTDTASVLQEAIEYIRFLHAQLSELSSSSMKNGCPVRGQQDEEGSKEDLKSRGLCLVPILSTFPVTAETAPDFWNPAFGGTFT